MCSHMDDFFNGGSTEFEKGVVEKLKERMGVESKETVKFKYIGVKIRHKKGKVVMSQRQCSRSMKEVPRRRFKGERELEEEEQSLYGSIKGQLIWLVQHSRPNLAVWESLGSKKLQKARTTNMRSDQTCGRICCEQRMKL